MSKFGARGQLLRASSFYAGSETDDALLTPIITVPNPQASTATTSTLPALSQRLRHTSSILSIALSDDYIYAGTQAGEILVYSLATFEKKAVVEGHNGSVLALCLSQDKTQLFSSAGDRVVNVWDTRTLRHLLCLCSAFDVGDVFCVAYSSTLKTVYLGAQNTTIQWFNQGEHEHVLPDITLSATPRGADRFFDSTGPGGFRTPRQSEVLTVPRHARDGQRVEIDKENVRQFAHYGYVYCMLLAKDGVPENAGNETLITGGGDGMIKLWKLDEEENGAIVDFYTLEDGREEGHAILSIALDGTFLYAGRTGGEVDVWDLETRQLMRNIKAHRDDVLTICVGGGYMFSGDIYGNVRRFDRQHQLKDKLQAHEGRILASAFGLHKQRPVYITGSSDSSLAVWDVSDSLRGSTTISKTSNEQLIDALSRFVSYRTVSSDPRFKVDCRRGASYLRSVFKNFGATTEMLTTEDSCNPIILARFRGNPATAAKRKKILFYGHYDVVAANTESGKWIVDPFTMQGIDGYLYGRGTSDNKGPIMAAIFACAELTREQALGSDITFLIEGEEECGSRGFEKTVRASKDKIGDIDWILLANSYWLDDRTPCLTYGLRGVIHATVMIESSHPDLHSGVDGSSQLDEPLKDLVLLLATLTGKGGEIRIPGFYDPIPEVTPQESELYAEITSALLQRNPDLGNPEVVAASLMRRWREASLTIHRFQTSGPDNNATIIPRMAKVSLSMRVVPNQEASMVGKSLISFLEKEFHKLDSSNRLTVTIDHQAEPWLGDLTNQLFKTLEEAIMEAWGSWDHTHRRNGSVTTFRESLPSPPNGSSTTKPSPATSSMLASGSVPSDLEPLTPVGEASRRLEALAPPDRKAVKERKKPLYIREGGSIPAIRFLEKEFDAPAAHFPCGQASDSAHLDNERLRLVNLYKSKDILKKVFRDLPQK
jgi:di- and tripeptidase